MLESTVMPNAVVPLASPIADKIDWTAACYPRVRGVLLRDERVAELLATLAEAVDSSRSLMRRAGIIAACRSCELEDGGSCCGAGIEDRYDGILLLINMLLGVELPSERQVADGCYFVSDSGCVLRVRQTICVSYLCTRVQQAVPSERLSALNAAEGREQETAFLLHDRIKRTVFDR